MSSLYTGIQMLIYILIGLLDSFGNPFLRKQPLRRIKGRPSRGTDGEEAGAAIKEKKEGEEESV